MSLDAADRLIVGELLVDAAENYLDWWEVFAERPSPEKEANYVGDVRDSGGLLAALFAHASRELAVSDSQQQLPDRALRCFRALADSYVLMSTVSSYEHLMQLPLATPEEIAADIAAPETERWLRETGVIG